MFIAEIEELAKRHPKANKPYEPYCGVAALFNADLYPSNESSGPTSRDEWEVISPYKIRFLGHTAIDDLLS